MLANVSHWLCFGTLSSWAEVSHLPSLGYPEIVGRSSHTARQQCQQCLCANKQCAPIVGRRFLQEKCAVYSRNKFIFAAHERRTRPAKGDGH
jgi:hypothetical protein